MRPTDWLKRLDELGPRVAVALGCGVGLGFVLLPGTVFGAALGLLGMGGLFVLGMSGRMLLVSTPRQEPAQIQRPAQIQDQAEVDLHPSPPVLPAPSSSSAVPWRIINSAKRLMRPIPGGEFWMGSGDEDEQGYGSEKPRHRVTVSPFLMMSVGVTQRLYRAVTKQEPPAAEEAELPMVSVSWFDAVTFCNALSEQLELRPCYRQTPDGWEWDRQADGFRLPTEAEREYATRAGSESRYSFGEDETNLGDYAWFAGNSDRAPHSVGQKRANDWGLHDLHGNVWEWCWDFYGPYSADSVSDPIGPSSRPERMLRGGSFLDGPGGLRSASRLKFMPANQNWDVGFRCVRSVSQKP